MKSLNYTEEGLEALVPQGQVRRGMQLWFATGNGHKRSELAAILGERHPVLIPSDRGIAFDPDETGSTFLENALIKARALYDLVHEPVIADDSGLSVDALGGRPGVYSARYAGRDNPAGSTKLSSGERNTLLLKEFREVEAESIAAGCGPLPRSARFTCAMVLLFSHDRFIVSQETFEGELIREERGNGGFGYDPILYLSDPGLTVAELSEADKNALSHRGKATRNLLAILDRM